MRSSLFAALFLFTVAGCTCEAVTPTCGDDDDCAGGKSCVEGACVAADGVACSLDDPCADGFTCSADDDPGDGGACNAIVGDGNVNDACAADDDCSTGACAGDVCVTQCTLDQACAEGLRCVLDGPRRVCVLPTGDGATGDACDDARDCLSGTCARAPAPSGGAADAVCAPACDDAHPCAGSDFCLALEGGARACFPAVADGAPCTSPATCAGGLCINEREGGAVCASACPAPQDDASCDDGFLCVDDADDNRVCMPLLHDFADGEDCADDRDCASFHCGRYVADGLDASLCASECPAEGCGEGQVCWEGDDVDLCGPTPP